MQTDAPRAARLKGGPIGASAPRIEDLRLTRGAGSYTDDFEFDGECWAVFVRATRPHARIKSLDVKEAAAAPGVLAALIARDYFSDGCRFIMHQANPPDAIDINRPSFDDENASTVIEFGQPPLAEDVVRFVGEAVVMIVAETLQQARDGAERVSILYEDLPHVLDARGALQQDAPNLSAAAPGNLCLESRIGPAEAVEQAFSRAHLVVERTFKNQRIVNCQMEPRAALARYDEASGFHVVAGSQGVVRQRVALAAALGVPPERLRLISPDVGGGFGPRTPLNPEVALVAWAARRLGRPVRWASDRSEAFLTDYQARDLWARTSVAFDQEGRILAVRVEQVGNLGAYPVSFAPLANGLRVLTTVYHVPVACVHLRGALTNTVPTAPYRGAGRPEATYAIERILDMAATRLSLDRVEIRLRNLVRRSDMPYRNPMGLTYDSGDFRANMQRALTLADWAGATVRKRLSVSHGLLRGIGVANYIEAPVGAAREKIILTIGPDGTVQIVAGTQSTGQGHATTFAQVAAGLLDVPIEAVRLVTGDTDLVKVGGGSHSDRSMRLVGALLVEACDRLLAQAREAAAHVLDVDADRLSFDAGRLHDRTSGRGVSLFELARQLDAGNLPTQLGAALRAEAEVSWRIPAHPTGCAICELTVDPETGVVVIDRYTSVDDVGLAINPMIVDGQVHGGIVQGLGQALFEKFACDASGQPLAASFMDYCTPRADSVPSFRVELAHDATTVPGNRMLVKGGGEGGITPATAAVVNALVDALCGYGVEDIEMPATPAAVWRTIQASTGGANATPPDLRTADASEGSRS